VEQRPSESRSSAGVREWSGEEEKRLALTRRRNSGLGERGLRQGVKEEAGVAIGPGVKTYDIARVSGVERGIECGV